MQRRIVHRANAILLLQCRLKHIGSLYHTAVLSIHLTHTGIRHIGFRIMSVVENHLHILRHRQLLYLLKAMLPLVRH